MIEGYDPRWKRTAERELLAGGTTTTGAPSVTPNDLQAFLELETGTGRPAIRCHRVSNHHCRKPLVA